MLKGYGAGNDERLTGKHETASIDSLLSAILFSPPKEVERFHLTASRVA